MTPNRSASMLGLIALLAFPFAANALTYRDVRNALDSLNARWTAKRTALGAAGIDEQRRRLGAIAVENGLHFEAPTTGPRTLPRHFDWRHRNGISYASPVLDQGRCGSCVAFATIGTLETQMNVSRNTPDSPWSYSAQHLHSCGGGSCVSGWHVGAAVSFLLRQGVPDALCFPYVSGALGQDTACRLTCADAARRSTRIAASTTPTVGTQNIDAVKRALLRGPVLTTMTVYEDFFHYGSGVYHYVTGRPVGGHAVSIVGWNDDERSWIVRNSWGRHWGEDGFFRIAWRDVSGVGLSTWSLDVGQADGFVTFGGPDIPVVLAGKARLPLRSTFPDLIGLEWKMLRSGVPVLEGHSATSADVEVDSSSVPDGVYELRATAVRRKGRVDAHPRRAYVLNAPLEGSVGFENLAAGQTLSGRVLLVLRLSLGPVPFTSLTFHARHRETGEELRQTTTTIAPTVHLSWRTTAHRNGDYDVWLEAAAGDVASIRTEPILITLSN
jgi:hypothetical protein